MGLLEKIKKHAETNSDKKIAMFVDMDGVIAKLDVDKNREMAGNACGWFLNKTPLKSVINLLEEISNIPNIDLYILSACVFKNQAVDKSKWLEKHAPFFKKENQIFVIKEVVKYTVETKPKIKSMNIVDTMRDKGDDLSIYFEDELPMLKKAYDLLGEKVMTVHISEFID